MKLSIIIIYNSNIVMVATVTIRSEVYLLARSVHTNRRLCSLRFIDSPVYREECYGHRTLCFWQTNVAIYRLIAIVSYYHLKCFGKLYLHTFNVSRSRGQIGLKKYLCNMASKRKKKS
jgi:hypothetical protein